MTKLALIAEDEPYIVDALTFILERNDYKVRVSHTGDHALRDAHNLKPTVMILDIMLPKRDGFDVLKALRADEDTRDLPILVLTAKGQDADKDKAMALGASYFLTKPFSNQEVLDTLERLIGHGG